MAKSPPRHNSVLVEADKLLALRKENARLKAEVLDLTAQLTKARKELAGLPVGMTESNEVFVDGQQPGAISTCPCEE